MCDPSTAFAVLGAAKGFMEHQSKVDATDAHNRAVARTHDSARKATTFRHTQETRKFVEESASNVERGFDASLEKKAAMATAQALGGANGVQGISVDAVIASEAQKGARNIGRVQMAQDNAYMDFLAGVDAATILGNEQIGANPFKEGPDMLSGVGNILGGAAAGYKMGGGKFSDLSIGGATSGPSTYGVDLGLDMKNWQTNRSAGWSSPVG